MILQIPVMRSPSFSYDLRLGGELLRIRLDWSETIKKWSISFIQPATGEPIVSGITVSPFVPLLAGYEAYFPLLGGNLLATSQDKTVLDRIGSSGISYEDITLGVVGIFYYDGMGA